ncbi:uncharacterized protein VNE69_11024 [Vairimorpha necatrix]|uniref:Coilin n=1 Tax=Vairimorpha necatrix TaxID=6039 RepID=A0AAX4JFV4_9MICR
MTAPTFLKIITESNKRFILFINLDCTTKDLIKQVKYYFAHYFKISYTVKYVYTPDKFVIFDNVQIKTVFKDGDFCYIKGRESEQTSTDEKTKEQIEDDISHSNKRKKADSEGPMILGVGLKKSKLKSEKNPPIANKSILSENKTTLLADRQDLQKNKITLKEENLVLQKNKTTKHDNNLDVRNNETPTKTGKSIFNKIPIITDKSILQKNKTPPSAEKSDAQNNKIPVEIVKTDVQNITNIKIQSNKEKEESLTEIPEQQNIHRKKNNKDERNFNVKNGVDPNFVKEKVLTKVIEDKKETKDDSLFKLENINPIIKEKTKVELNGIKQIKKKKKINYEEL